MMSLVFKCLVTRCQLMFKAAWNKLSKIVLNNRLRKERFSKFSLI